MKKNDTKQGVFYASLSYILWGLLPVYWKFLDKVNPMEILANRVFWSFVFMIVLLLLTRKWGGFLHTFKSFAQNKKQLYALILASILISLNWFTYIWAVNNGHMIEASLGYYINPLVSIILGMAVLKEKLTSYQYLSFLLAAIGVLIISFSHGQFPWIAIVLALSFGLYGLAKKLINVESAVGLTLETLMVTPIALIYMGVLMVKGQSAFVTGNAGTEFFLAGAGVVTAVPLLYFAKGARMLPLSLLGFIQYLSPTLTLILGIFVYHEHFSKVQFLSFIFIWLALTIYSLSKTKLLSARAWKWRREKRAI